MDKQMLERMQRKGNPSVLLVGMQTGEAIVENRMEFPQKTKNRNAFRSSNSTAGIKNPETLIQKNLCTLMFIATLFAIAKYWKQPKCPSANEWIQKLWYIYTRNSMQQKERRSLYPLQQHGWNWRALC